MSNFISELEDKEFVIESLKENIRDTRINEVLGLYNSLSVRQQKTVCSTIGLRYADKESLKRCLAKIYESDRLNLLHKEINNLVNPRFSNDEPIHCV